MGRSPEGDSNTTENKTKLHQKNDEAEQKDQVAMGVEGVVER